MAQMGFKGLKQTKWRGSNLNKQNGGDQTWTNKMEGIKLEQTKWRVSNLNKQNGGDQTWTNKMEGIKLEQTKWRGSNLNKQKANKTRKSSFRNSQQLFPCDSSQLIAPRYQVIAETKGRIHYRYRTTGPKLIRLFRSMRRHQKSIDKQSK